ncbi:MAG: hypothetical protein AB2392_20740 [Neobacillus sp.]
MKTFAKFVSKNTTQGLKIFRHHTEFRSENGPGDAIGLVCMMNPGDARPISDTIFNHLQKSEYNTVDYVLTKPDKTMSKAIRLVKAAFEHNAISLPNTYTIHVENLFNIREKDSKKAIKFAKTLRETSEIMYKSRILNPSYHFVFLAWGNIDINEEKQNLLMNSYSNAIKVNKLNHKGQLLEVNYPVHPLYMNTNFFLEATNQRIIGF